MLTHLASLTLIFIISLTLLPTARAHGYVAQVTIDGTLYVGNVPNASPTPSIVRQINNVAPVKGANNSNLNCGQDAQKAALVASANPGSKLTFSWKGGDGSDWPHNIGPIMTYMTPCLNTTCDQYDSTNAMWFKVDEVGLESGNSTWYQQNLMNGYPANVTIPETLEPGEYLIRHEIIALHLANEMGGAEFYPSCTQVQVKGSQTGGPLANETVTFPGGYSDTAPGIYDPNIFNTPLDNYVFPGPPIAQFVLDSSGSSSNSSSSSSPSPTSSSPVPLPSSTGSGAGNASCKLRVQSMNVQRPRSVSRIMRDLLF
ncbi:glycoside hydrolase family 61 protein [Serpula lacrymans var. lacrymans S7.3]|uniref:lytic cellulose monooxygenase (C4-dehydrogenating) n=2 Tax=Serpula lacrymans var. lacrymans TaxID=341189 RepID=F8QBR9_SERL3|nr:glycoside hydrolase family 61 protein [Serpula lacrymans var. lacrymans S7.9]EGN94280.1 glycoside hydrolase family 61 protein [Serpula lacrymans var. lacrymans S7.3]EGO19771.1 glycoside hydrolase family 61 protein [Serpula lacrymans var. lacrymans S7.9]